jgi:hypothetical protein
MCLEGVFACQSHVELFEAICSVHTGLTLDGTMEGERDGWNALVALKVSSDARAATLKLTEPSAWNPDKGHGSR